MIDLRSITVLAVLIVFVFGRTGLAQPVQPSPQQDQKQELRILCYNIHHGEGVDRKLDLERIAKVILSVKPDLVGLQEVDVKTTRTKKVDQAKKLAELTKMNFVFGKNIEFGGGSYGNAILSRFPISKSENHKLPNYLDGEQRGLLVAEVQPEFMKSSIRFWNTHFDHRKVTTARLKSAQMCNQLLGKKNGSFNFLVGDFNSVVGSSPIETLEYKWKKSNSSPLPTVPVSKPSKQIDFVWSAKGTKATCIQTKVLPEAVASDHRAILAVYRLDLPK